jgi:hypothetical protein
MRLKKFLPFLFLIQSLQLHGALVENAEVNVPWTGLMRVRALESLDKMLSIAFDQKYRSYKLLYPLYEENFKNNVVEAIDFERSFGYFSPNRPLVGHVTGEKEDIALTCQLLKDIHQQITAPVERRITSAEVLTKILAYRNLKEGMEVPIPIIDKSDKPKLMTYTVDSIFDLWHGMPAFGLVPKDRGKAAPILLYRGTDLSFGTERGWASVISDLNTSGPGLTAFLNAQQSIHEWLKKVAEYGVKARVMGYSLGGVLTAYTTLYEHDLINQDKKHPSLSFNPPGVSKAVLDQWQNLPENKKIPLSVFVVRGDLVSKIGLLFGDVVEFSVENGLKPIAAHVILVSGQPFYRYYKVNVEKENLSR